MEETYERQLTETATSLPERPSVIALVPTVSCDEAAGLASDLAQSVGSGSDGHTLLTSFEPAPARLDHEIGVESGFGLTDVLSKAASMGDVAARGKARHFIYVPAGASPATGESLLHSSAWRSLRASALRGGGTVLAFVPVETFLSLAESMDGGAALAPPFDGIVWLGSPSSTDALSNAAESIGVAVLGGIELPGGPRDVVDAGASTTSAAPSSPHHRIVTGPGATRRHLTSHGRVQRGGILLLIVLLGLLGVAVVYFTTVADPRGR